MINNCAQNNVFLFLIFILLLLSISLVIVQAKMQNKKYHPITEEYTPTTIHHRPQHHSSHTTNHVPSVITESWSSQPENNNIMGDVVDKYY